MSRIAVTLYNQEGELQQGLNPQTTASQVEIYAEDGTESTVEAEIEALRTTIAALENGGASFKGTLTSTSGLPTIGYKAGWQFVVAEAGTYAGQQAEVGEMFIAIRDYASGSANASKDWTLLQVNIVGAVTGPATSVTNRVAVFDGTTGKIIKDSGFTIGASVPADAKFTDTTYAAATAQKDGLLTAALFSKLNGIEAGADKTDTANVSAAGAVMKTETSDVLPQGSTNLYFTAEERAKLAGIEEGAVSYRPAFDQIWTDTGTLHAYEHTHVKFAGDGIDVALRRDSVTNKHIDILFSEKYIDVCTVTSLDNVPANLRNGGLIILKNGG